MHLTRRQFLHVAGLAAGLSVNASVLKAQSANYVGADQIDLKVGLISDLNSSYGSLTYIPHVSQGLQHLISLRPSLIVCAGDMIAGQKRELSSFRLDAMWGSFARNVLLPASRSGIPFMPAVGNHDGAPGFELDRASLRHFWNSQRDSLGLNFVDIADFPFHYTVLQDDVFWLVWDASSAFIPQQQISWARRQLASPAAYRAKLRFVVGHLPLVGISQGRDKPGEYLANSSLIHDVLETGNVHGYISGHQHAWYSGRKGQLDLICLGALGGGPRRLIQGGKTAQNTYSTLDISWANQQLIETAFTANDGVSIAWNLLPDILESNAGKISRNSRVRPIRM